MSDAMWSNTPCALPTAWKNRPPVIDGITYLDGALTSPVPVSVARAMGADLVIAVDITRWKAREIAEEDLRKADFVIRPQTVRARINGGNRR